MKTLLLILVLSLPAFAQKDFLTDSEIEQVREAQEPVARIKLYLLFAKQRLDQTNSLIAKNRAGRSAEVRQLLEDYTSIIDAIGTVSDDALGKRIDVTLGTAVISDGEHKLLDQLTKIQGSNPHDLEMYAFDLKEAIAATNDSLGLLKQDLGDRSREVNARIAEEKKQVDAVNAAEKRIGGSSNRAADKSEAAAQEAVKPTRQAPTLYRPGEKPEAPKDPNDPNAK